MAFVDSFVNDLVTGIDHRLDALQAWVQSSGAIEERTVDGSQRSRASSRVLSLQSSIQKFSVPTRPVSTAQQATSLKESLRSLDVASDQDEGEDKDLEWVALGKASTRAYGLCLNRLLQQIVPLSSEITYWHEVLTSQRYTALYSLQISPLRLWNYSQDAYNEARQTNDLAKAGWSEFYGLVHSVVKKRSYVDIRASITQPMATVREGIRAKLASLERAKRVYAGSIGYLMSNRLLPSVDQSLHSKWQKEISESVTTLDTALRLSDRTQGAETSTSEALGSARALSGSEMSKIDVIQTLQTLLGQRLPEHIQSSDALLQANARPSRLIRYWLPATALLLSSSTILRLVLNRKAAILEWIRNIGDTTLDFWLNWVVEPGRKLVGTIRHDESSQVSIMSKRSLEGDRASLERMVVDFAEQISPKGTADMDSVRKAVQEGDLTPVLRAYERELQRPLYNSLRGNLVRALLIQIQKTKVDVEVAIGGIDALLKSQELVFGFVGLTPGLLVCVGAYRWLRNTFGNRQSYKRGSTQKDSIRLLRNMDRILTSADRASSGTLPYESFGLLVCEAIVLRDLASRAFPKSTFREFIRDFDALIDVQSGVDAQMRVIDRIRWAYTQYS